MQLGLLLLFCGAALSVSTSIQHVRHAKVKRNPQAQKAQKALQAEKSVKRTWKSVGSNTECKGAGEVYREKSPGKLSNLEECKKSCQNEAGCQSITYFHDGWCSHFSTACTKTNWIDKAIAMQLSSAQVKRNPQAQKAQKALQAEKKPEDGDDDEDDTTAEPENGDDEPDPPPADDGVKRTWKLVGSNTECKGAGEVYRVQSPGKLPNLEECKKSCQNEAGCQSITYFQSGWCSHFSTPCTKTKSTNKAIAMKLSSASGSTIKPKTTIGVKRTWQSVGAKTTCDTSAGEVYQKTSPGKLSSLEKCKNSCQNDPGCKSITFFKSGWCSHFSTACTKTNQRSSAVEALRLITARRQLRRE